MHAVAGRSEKRSASAQPDERPPLLPYRPGEDCRLRKPFHSRQAGRYRQLKMPQTDAGRAFPRDEGLTQFPGRKHFPVGTSSVGAISVTPCGDTSSVIELLQHFQVIFHPDVKVLRSVVTRPPKCCRQPSSPALPALSVRRSERVEGVSQLIARRLSVGQSTQQAKQHKAQIKQHALSVAASSAL